MKLSGYVRPLNEVREIRETTDWKETNRLVRNGWMLLRIITPNRIKPQEILFSLGKVSVPVDSSDRII